MQNGTAGPRLTAVAAFQIAAAVHSVAGMFGKAEPLEFDEVFPEWGDVDAQAADSEDQRQARLVAWFKRSQT